MAYYNSKRHGVVNLEGLVYWRVCLLIIDDSPINLLQKECTLCNLKCPSLDLIVGIISTCR